MTLSLSGLSNLNPLSMLSNAVESTCDAILPKELEFVGDIAGMVADIRTGNYLKLAEDMQDLLKDLPQQLSALAKKQGQGDATADWGADPSGKLEPPPPPVYSASVKPDGDALLAPSDDDIKVDDDGLMAPTDDVKVDNDGLLAPSDDGGTKRADNGNGSTGTAAGASASRGRNDSTTTSATRPSTELNARTQVPTRAGFGAPPPGATQAPVQRGRPPGGESRGVTPTPSGASSSVERKTSASTAKPSASDSSATSTSPSKTAASKTDKADKTSDSAASSSTKTTASANTSESSKAAESASAPKTATASASMTPDAFFKLSDKDLMNAVRDGKIPEAVTKDPEQMRRLQVRMNDITQMNQMLTSIIAAIHEMNKQIIQNLRV